MASSLMQMNPWYDLRTKFRIASSLSTKALAARYARTLLGPIWMLLTPLAMICVYWTVFGFVLGVQWRAPTSGQPVPFILPFMAGLAVYLYFAEVATSSLNMFVSRRNYVRKSPVPLWVLWLSGFMTSSVLGAVNLLILLALTIIYGVLTISGLLWALPTLILTVALFAGTSLILALIGPFVGDIANAIAVILRVLFYSAPITYPLSIIPERYQVYLWLNPLTPIVEQLRSALLFDMGIYPRAEFALFCLATVVCAAAYWLYARVYKAIYDVV